MVEEDIEGRWESVRLTESEVPTLSVRGLRGAGELGWGWTYLLALKLVPGAALSRYCSCTM